MTENCAGNLASGAKMSGFECDLCPEQAAMGEWCWTIAESKLYTILTRDVEGAWQEI